MVAALTYRKHGYNMATQMYILWKIKNYTGIDVDYDIKFNSPSFSVDIDSVETQWRLQFQRPYVVGGESTDMAIKVQLVRPASVPESAKISYHIHLIDSSNNEIHYTFKSEADVFNLTQCSESLLKDFNLFAELHMPTSDSDDEATNPVWLEAQSFFEQGNDHYLNYSMYPTVPNGEHAIKKLIINKHRTVWCMKFLCSMKHNRKISLSLARPPENWAVVLHCEDFNFMSKRNESRVLIYDEHLSEYELNAGYKTKNYILHPAYWMRSSSFGKVNPNLIEKFRSWVLPIIHGERASEEYVTLIKTKAEPAPLTQPDASIIPTAIIPFQHPSKLMNGKENDLPPKQQQQQQIQLTTAAAKWKDDEVINPKIQNIRSFPSLPPSLRNSYDNLAYQPKPFTPPLSNVNFSVRPPPPPPPSVAQPLPDVKPNFLQEMYANKQFCDVKLSIDGRIIQAHKLVLACSCTYFHDLLAANSENNGTVELTKYDYVTMEALVAFIYNDSLPQLPVTVLEQLLTAADEFGMAILKRRCEAELAATLTIRSVASMLVLAHLRKADVLMVVAVEFVRMHIGELQQEKGIQTIFFAYPKLAYELFLRLLSK